MRSLGSLSAAAALCVCCVLPSYDAVDRLPGEGQGATSSGAGSSSGGKSNLTSASGGKNNGSSGSGVGAEGGDDPMGTSGSEGTGGTEPDSGGMNSGGTPPTGGAAPGGAGGAGGVGGASGAGGAGGAGGVTPVGGMGGVPPVGGAGGAGPPGGAGGAGGVSNQCFQWCQGSNNVRMKCPNHLGSKLNTEANCLNTCQLSSSASVTCWVQHTANAESATSVHCTHATGSPGNGVCPELP